MISASIYFRLFDVEIHSLLSIYLISFSYNTLLSSFILIVICIGHPESSPLYTRVLNILESQDKIPYIQKIGKKYYNFWQDQNHLKGILRRTTLESYQNDKPEWETVIDLDALSKQENENWVYKGKSVMK